ncbi:alpha/beta hydrolase [Leifsonia sp. NPDC080035]|uniref:Alpha/beta hydrolase n=1 Tax=Leifsonia sp. NPDC080035 TaxID=3143936 RepID=A0AAU7GJ20_9MICO
MAEPDIRRLREDAAARAAGRPRLPFDGSIADTTVGPVAARSYRPDRAPDPALAGTAVAFLHGGYGVLGDIELQDGYCRRIAGILCVPVLSVGYRLAPEARLDDAAHDAVTAADALRGGGGDRVVLWGDSAGGAVAIAAARAARADTLVLSNPNVDLTLAGYDDSLPGGPARELSEWAFVRWSGATRPADAPDLAADVAGLPPVFAAVGSEDSLLPDARRLVERCRAAGIRAELTVVPGAEHGFMGGPDLEAADDVIRAAGRFIAPGAQSDPHLLLDI